MSHADCARVAKGVFLDTTTLYFRDLVATVQRRVSVTRATWFIVLVKGIVGLARALARQTTL